MDTQGTAAPAAGAGALRRWRWLLAGVILLALYALAGFVGVPWLIERQLPQVLRSEIGREASLGRAEFNPFALRLRLADFKLLDTDGTRLAAFDQLLVDVQASSLWNRALTLGELRLVAPYLNVVRQRDGGINLLKLVPPGPEPPPDETGELPRLIVQEFRLDKGAVDFTDQVPATPFRTRIGPFDMALDEISTLPDASGRHQLAISLESGTQLRVAGDLSVTPLRAGGQVTLKGPAFGLVHRYIRDQLKFDVTGGATEAALRFNVREVTGGAVEAEINDLNLRLRDVGLTSAAAPDFLAFTEFAVSGGRLRWPASEIAAERVTLRGLRLRARREADGRIDLIELLEPASVSAPPEAASVDARTAAGAGSQVQTGTGSSPNWTLRIAQASVEDASLAFTDAAPSTPAVFTVSDLDLTVRDLSSEPGARLPLEVAVALEPGGSVTLAGNMTALPAFALDGEVAAKDIPLALLQPYVSDMARVKIRAGTIAVDGRLASTAEETLAFDGDVRVRELDTYDQLKQERLLGWQEMRVDDLRFQLDAGRARVTRVRLDRPFGRIFIARDQSTNIGDLMIEPAAAPAAVPAVAAARPAAPPSAGFEARIGKFVVRKGEVDFTDLSLPLPFAARVHELQGEFTTIDTRSTAPSRLRFEGRVEEYGLAQVEGQVRASAPTDLADVTVVFRNIEMAPLSPYTVKFAGRKIARGKINLDLRYQLADRRLVGANKIVIDELELGEKVPHPEAVDLPLGLAVALLKDANGRIDVDMPVAGSLDDPQFRIGSVLWKAFVNLVTKIATAPFRLLGSLIGVESADLGRVDFPPGRAELLPPEKEKLLRVAEALGKRPELAVVVPAVADPEADAAVLRTQKTEALVEQGLAASGRPQSGRGLEKRTREVIEELFLARFPGEDIEVLQAQFRAPPPEDPQGKPRLDELAYLDELRARIAAGQPVRADELASLATARAAAIGTELTTAGGVAAARVQSGERQDVKARDGQWISVELGLDSAMATEP